MASINLDLADHSASTPNTVMTAEEAKQKQRQHGKSNQFRAMFLKNCSLQSRQIGTNLCQIVVPVALICFIGIMQLIVNALVPTSEPVTVKPPAVPLNFFLNKTLSQLVFYQKYLYYVDERSNYTLQNMLGSVWQATLKYNNEQYVVPMFEQRSSPQEMHDELLSDLDTIRLHSKQQFYRNATYRLMLPDGTYTFDEVSIPGITDGASSASLNYTIAVNDNPFYQRNNIGNPANLPPAVSFTTARMIAVAENAFMQTALSESKNNNITQCLAVAQGLPYVQKPEKIDVMDILGIALFPFAISFLMPVFLYTLTMEKELRLREMMKMLGLKPFTYWANNYFFDLILFSAVALVFVACELAFRVRFFTQSSPLLSFLLFFLWGNSMIAMAFFLSTLFSRSRSATVFGYLLVIVSVIAAEVLNGQVYMGSDPPVWYWLYPPFAFYRGVYLMFMACNNLSCLGIQALSSSSSSTGLSQMSKAFAYMAGEVIVLCIATAYFDAVMPSEFGVPKHPLFFLGPIKDLPRRLFEACKKSFKRKNTAETTYDDASEEPEDEDVVAERIRVYEGAYDPDSPMVVKDLHKKYASGKVAVKSISFALSKNESLGLLGPNGAGKTTTISILTGLFPPTSGTAFVGGYDIRTQMEQIHKEIGVCPQFDVLWPDLTVREHLLFCARLRGIPRKQELKHVNDLIRDVGLENAAKKKSKELSGGMKRRLSLAMAVVGNPKVIFLDEPTTGLDPESKRQVWDCITKAKENRCMILTTHSMEEADVLCNKIAIVAQGSIKCFGNQLHLKRKFGDGFHLTISFDPENGYVARGYIHQILPTARLTSSFPGLSTFQIPEADVSVSKLFYELESHKTQYGIKNWGLNQTSLEDVFLKIAKE